MKKVLSVAAVILAVAVLGGVTVFAAGNEAFSYLKGQQRSSERINLYAEAETLPEDEQDAFLEENGVGETLYSEDAAASYSFVTGQATGSQYETADDENNADYSYLTGQKSSTERNDIYAEAETLPEDEQDAFLEENGVGETPYSEEAAENYSYNAGQQRGASYRQSDDSERTQDTTEYGYLIGQQRGASYQK